MSCYKCGEAGHKYRNCPKIINHIKEQKEREWQEKLSKRVSDDKQWLADNMPDTDKVLINSVELKNIMLKAISRSFKLEIFDKEPVRIYLDGDYNIYSYDDSSLGRFFRNKMSIDEFLLTHLYY